MRKQNNFYFYSLIFALLFFTSCGSKSIEQHVEIVITSNDFDERQKSSYALADSLNIKAADLLFGLYPNRRVNESLKNILYRYSEIIIEEPSKSNKALDCVSFITQPTSPPNDILNSLKIELIIYGLQDVNLSLDYEEALINSAKLHGTSAMIKILDAWYSNKNSVSILNAIKGFDREAISYLIKYMDSDTIAIDLLARFGHPVVNRMIEKMSHNDQSIRFAAGDVLVQMLKYDPKAVEMLTSAINNEGIKIIAKNYPFYIRLGKPGTEELLLRALDSYFDKEMCVDYLNCGNNKLESGATDIAKKYGYMVMSSFGRHSGPKWGSGN